ncbi:MAG: hypothetical protein WC781_00565 [Candidatus Pacearchaeota archaeon]|jgi:hypothetical protein
MDYQERHKILKELGDGFIEEAEKSLEKEYSKAAIIFYSTSWACYQACEEVNLANTCDEKLREIFDLDDKTLEITHDYGRKTLNYMNNLSSFVSAYFGNEKNLLEKKPKGVFD